MSSHLINGEFQSDKYPTCPRGKVPLSTSDPMAQELLWIYSISRQEVDPEFSKALQQALINDGFDVKDYRIRSILSFMDTLDELADGTPAKESHND